METQIPRWRLTAPHYLNAVVNGAATEWEQVEVDRDSGKQLRKRYKVPVYLDPKNPGDFNYPGEIIVAHGAYNRDVVFEGPPTIDMEPLNDTAEALSKEAAKRGIHPIESLPSQGVSYGEQVLEKFTRQLEGLMAKNPLAKMDPVSTAQVSVEQFEEMQRQMAQLMEQNARLMEMVTSRPVAEEPLEKM